MAARVRRAPAPPGGYLFLAVLFDVRLRCLFRMAVGMNGMAGRTVGVVRGGLVLPGLVMLGGFRMVAGRMREVF